MFLFAGGTCDDGNFFGSRFFFGGGEGERTELQSLELGGFMGCEWLGWLRLWRFRLAEDSYSVRAICAGVYQALGGVLKGVYPNPEP